MNFERMKVAIKNRELLGLEPYYLLKTILERQQASSWGIQLIALFVNQMICLFTLDEVVSGGQMFEESILQFIDCKQPDPSNQLIASPQEQLMGSAKFNAKSKLNFHLCH